MNIFNTPYFGKSYLKISVSHWQFPLLVHVLLCPPFAECLSSFQKRTHSLYSWFHPLALPLHHSMSRVFIISKEHPQSALKLFSLSITTNLFLQDHFPFLFLLVLSEVLDTTDLSLLLRSSSAQCSHTVLSSDQDSAPSQCSSGSLPSVSSSLLTLRVGSPQDSAY